MLRLKKYPLSLPLKSKEHPAGKIKRTPPHLTWWSGVHRCKEAVPRRFLGKPQAFGHNLPGNLRTQEASLPSRFIGAVQRGGEGTKFVTKMLFCLWYKAPLYGV